MFLNIQLTSISSTLDCVNKQTIFFINLNFKVCHTNKISKDFREMPWMSKLISKVFSRIYTIQKKTISSLSDGTENMMNEALELFPARHRLQWKLVLNFLLRVVDDKHQRSDKSKLKPRKCFWALLGNLSASFLPLNWTSEIRMEREEKEWALVFMATECMADKWRLFFIIALRCSARYNYDLLVCNFYEMEKAFIRSL